MIETSLIHESLTRPVLLGGADRRLTIINLGLSGMLVLLTGFSLYPTLSALFLCTLCQWAFVKITKIDPYLIDIYPRHLVKRRVYLSKPDISQ